MKQGTFRKVNFSLERGNGYGQYIIAADYRGKRFSVHSTDSEMWDWLDDDSDMEKHNAARKACYMCIVRAYNEL